MLVYLVDDVDDVMVCKSTPVKPDIMTLEKLN